MLLVRLEDFERVSGDRFYAKWGSKSDLSGLEPDIVNNRARKPYAWRPVSIVPALSIVGKYNQIRFLKLFKLITFMIGKHRTILITIS